MPPTMDSVAKWVNHGWHIGVVFQAFMVVNKGLFAFSTGIWNREKPHPVRRRNRENTPLAYGFRRRSENHVPETFPRRKFPGSWCDGSSGATSELARGTRALPRPVLQPEFMPLAVWAWASGPGFRRGAWYRPRPIHAPCGAGWRRLHGGREPVSSRLTMDIPPRQLPTGGCRWPVGTDWIHDPGWWLTKCFTLIGPQWPA